MLTGRYIMAGATTGYPRVRKSPLRAKPKSGGNGTNFDDPSMWKLDYRSMDGNLPSPSSGSFNNISAMARPSSASGTLLEDCVSNDLGATMNTSAGFNLRKPESNNDEGFVRGWNNNRRAFNGGKNPKSAENTGKNLVMGNVTILKRGENIEDVVSCVKSADKEENDIIVKTSLHVAENPVRGGKRLSGGYFHGRISEGCSDYSRGAADKKTECQAVVGGSKFASARTVQKKKTKAPFRTSQVCPVSPSYDSTAKSYSRDGAVCVDELDKLGKNYVITSADRLGPDPSTILKDVSSGILRSVSTGSRFSEEIKDVDLPVILPELVTRRESSMKSGTRSASSSGPTESPAPNSLRDWWAGPAYTNSPSPSCLPLPKYFLRHKMRSNPMESNGLVGDDYTNIGTTTAPESAIRDNKKQIPLDVKQFPMGVTNQVGVDAFATRNLRRLLQLE